MSSAMKTIPTLGYFNKVICDCLGIWSSEKNDILFNVPATEEERRKKLREAFNSISKDDGSYGSFDELLSITSKTSPEAKEVIRKNRTIQDHTNYLSKEDFSSHHEFIEFKDYINIVISDKYDNKSIATMATEVYWLSMQYYKEFVREHAIKPGYELDSYLFFVKNILPNVINTSVNVVSRTTLSTNNQTSTHEVDKTPIRSFVDAVTNLCNVSLHQLHQFHEVKLNNSTSSDEEIWNSDLTSQPVNTKSKQIIDRLNKNSKIKWEIFLNEIRPLISLLPNELEEDAFVVSAYSAFVMHNLHIHANKIGKDVTSIIPSWVDTYPSVTATECGYLPVSLMVDRCLNSTKTVKEATAQETVENYEHLVQRFRLLDSSLIGKSDFPSTLAFVYGAENPPPLAQDFQNNPDELPIWMSEWNLARKAVAAGKLDSGVQHYKKSLQSSKYTSGSLFIALYIEICAFCKHQYKELSQRNEQHIFERFFEPLGADASSYAGLLGYTPNDQRDPKTLMPVVSEKIKNSLIIRKIDAMASTFRSLVKV